MDPARRFFRPGTATIEAAQVARFDGPDTSVIVDPAGQWATFHRQERVLRLRNADGEALVEQCIPSLPELDRGLDRPSWQVEQFAFDLVASPIRVAHLLRDRIVIHSESGVVADHRHIPWGSQLAAAACFSRNGDELWAAVPGEPGDRQVRSGHLIRIDASDGREIGAVALDDDWPDGYRFARHPGQDAAILDAGYGQDGTWLWTIQAVNNDLVVERLDSTDQTMGGFAPDGSQFVTAPHGAEDLVLRSWPNGLPLVRFSNVDIFVEEPADAEPDWLYYWASYLSDQAVLALTAYGQMVRLSADTDPMITRVLLPGYSKGSTDEHDAWFGDQDGRLQWFDVVGRGSVVTRHVDGHLDLWRVP